MSIRMRVALAGATAVATGGVLVAALGGGASAAGDKRVGWPKAGASGVSAEITTGKTLHLITTEDAGRNIDVGPRGVSPGDYAVFEETLRNEAGKVVGRDSARCMLMVTTYRCDATFRINGKGNIEVAASFFQGGGATLAVTGGTGTYQNARGQARIVNDSGSGTHFVFTLLP